MMGTARFTLQWGSFVLDGLVHTAPCDKQGRMIQGHVQSMDCWCAPELEAHCPACVTGDIDTNCWRCEGTGFIDGSILDPPRVAHVIHRNINDDEDE